MKHSTKQYLLKFWFIFWLILSVFGVMDIITHSVYAWLPFNVTAFVVMIVNLSVYKWLYWWFVTTKKCDHESGEWKMKDFGMGKVRHCKKCGKCLEIL